MKFFNEQEGANNGSPFVEIVVYVTIIVGGDLLWI